MTAPSYDAAKLNKLEAELAAGRAAVQGVNDAARDANDRAREARAIAHNCSLFPVDGSQTMEELMAQHIAERQRLGAGDPLRTSGSRDESHARKVHQLLNAIEACAAAADAEMRARALREEVARRNADIAPLAVLVKRCREYAGRTGAQFNHGG